MNIALSILSRPFSFLSASVCGIFLLYAGALPSLYFDKIPVRETLFPLVIILADLLSLALGIGFSRFLSRVLQIRSDGQRRRCVIWFGMIASLVWLGIWSGIYFNGPVQVRPREESMWFMETAPGVRLGGYLAAVFWWLGAFVPFLARHLAVRRATAGPFVLFLRRFSTFSDRSVVSAVMKCAPSGKPVAFLTPHVSAPGDWNPFLIGFAGLKIWRPFRSLPLFLRARDENWRAVAADLISRAELIVLDRTTASDSVNEEIEMIRHEQCLDKTVFLDMLPDGKTDTRDVPHAATEERGTSITYRKSWMRAFPRMTLGIIASLLGALPIAMLSLILVAGYIYGWAQLQSPTGIADIMQSQWKAIAIAAAILYAWIYSVLFLRPSLDGGSVRQLRKKLK